MIRPLENDVFMLKITPPPSICVTKGENVCGVLSHETVYCQVIVPVGKSDVQTSQQPTPPAASLELLIVTVANGKFNRFPGNSTL